MSDHVHAFTAYVPEDRLVELAGGMAVPGRGDGAVLFADVVGFTGLTTRLAGLFGPRRGAEEVPRYLDRLYEAVIGEVRAFGGSVIGFAGDAVTCWFPGDPGSLAWSCGNALQRAMAPFADIELEGAPKGESVTLALKVLVTAGRVSRFVVGDPEVQLIDVIAGGPVAQIEELEGAAVRGKVVASPDVARALGAWPSSPVEPSGMSVAPAHVSGASGSDVPAAADRWLLPTVRRRLAAGGGDFLTELRPVAALFLSFGGIDLDSPGAAGRFDSVVRAAQRVATDYGGNVLQVTSGDKGNYLYLAFGAPVAHEDDARRCAAAALELRDELARLDFAAEPRLGLGHGTARTGPYGSAARRTYGALGEGTNMAARLMSAAPPAAIYVSAAFAAALGGGFDLREIAGLHVKGRSAPVSAYELTGHGQVLAGAPTRAARGRLIGRDAEVELLVAKLRAAAGGAGQVVQLVADAGVGKSELLAHVLARVSELHVVRGACQAFGRTAPYQLWRGVYRQLLGLEDGARAEGLGAVETALARLDPSLAGQAGLLAPVLDLTLESGPAGSGADAQERDTARRALLLTLFRLAVQEAWATGATLVLLLEDLHWLDAASEELLHAVAAAAPAAGAAVLTTSRPADGQGEAPGTLAGATRVELEPLTAVAARELVEVLLAEALGPAEPPPTGDLRVPADQLPAARRTELAEAIAHRAGGNPFYLHELVADLRQRAAAGALDASAAPELPTSLHSLILGRLDRLADSQRQDVKVASVVGREFQTAWVVACRPETDAAAVEGSFRGTDALGLTRPLAGVSAGPMVGSTAGHEFNHAITHEVTYESQSRESRARLHTVLARHLETNVASSTEPRLDLLAHHYSLGVDREKARQYLRAAGVAAKAAYANQAALDYFRRLLALQEGRERLDTLLELGEVASFVGSYVVAREHLDEALALAQLDADQLAHATALRLLGELLERQGDHPGARDRLAAAAEACRRLGADAELTRVLLASGGNVLWNLGQYDEAEAQLAEAVRLARAAGDVRAEARALHGVANVHLYRGNTAAAEAAFTESLAVRRAAGDDYGVANGLNNLAIVRANAGDNQRAEELFAESLAIRRRLGDAAGIAVALNNLGYMAEARDDLVRARQLYEESLAARRVLGDRLGLAVSLNNLAGLTFRAGDTATARDLWTESATLATAAGNRREAATALAGLAIAVEDAAAGARLALVAEHVFAVLGAAVEPEVREQIEQGKARSAAAAGVADLSADLAPLVAWALG